MAFRFIHFHNPFSRIRNKNSFSFIHYFFTTSIFKIWDSYISFFFKHLHKLMKYFIILLVINYFFILSMYTQIIATSIHSNIIINWFIQLIVYLHMKRYSRKYIFCFHLFYPSLYYKSSSVYWPSPRSVYDTVWDLWIG